MKLPVRTRNKGASQIDDAQGRLVCSAYRYQNASPDDAANNAELIVRAVNAHSDLVEALQTMVDDPESQDAHVMAHAVLAKLEGPAP